MRHLPKPLPRLAVSLPTTTSSSTSRSIRFCRPSAARSPEEAFTVWGITQLGFYARTHWQVSHPKTYIDSGYSFNLGYSFPTALGVKVARPDRPVVCVVGDGGFMFNASELATAVKYGINTTTVVFR